MTPEHDTYSGMAGPYWARLADVLEFLEGRYAPGEEFTVKQLGRAIGGHSGELRAKLMRLRADGLVAYQDGRWWLIEVGR